MNMIRKIAIIPILAFSLHAFGTECINNDLIWPKLVIYTSDSSSYNEAISVLAAAEKSDKTGESLFYKAALEHRLKLYKESLQSIEKSASVDYHFAHAFFGLAYQYGYLGFEQSIIKSQTHYKKYLDAAKKCSEFEGSHPTEEQGSSLVMKLFEITPIDIIRSKYIK
ncbi:hypothetical protein [Pseudomonas benzenivorans]|uniref:Tetratricopeptide repeat-containing protein n=1 Tax=Pseudomonas benzenivorans TaxID=556533 RepID=A0ABY5H6N8_9PSED|nr:hypothetical protein [Pseudomonas benzenivorans]UTW07978.1 hypothetical protein KDW96_01175 [Pseudomonas benzenivorans]